MSLSFSYLYGFLLVLLVVEARDKQRGAPLVVERWGDPESSKCVMAVSMIDRESHPVCIGNFFFCSGSVCVVLNCGCGHVGVSQKTFALRENAAAIKIVMRLRSVKIPCRCADRNLKS